MTTPVGGGTAAPLITGVTPATGPVGTAVTITGVGFTGATLVRFHTTDQPGFTLVDASTITTTVPAGATTGPVQVVTPAGTATSPATFTVSTVTARAEHRQRVGVEGGTATFTVTLSSSSSQTVTVGYATAAGTATAGSDYTATSGTLTFAPGVTSQAVLVGVLGDSVDELDETLTVSLSTPVNATWAWPPARRRLWTTTPSRR